VICPLRKQEGFVDKNTHPYHSVNKKLRFDIVVFNHHRLELFLNNFSKIINFNKEIDRITIVSCSPSPMEGQTVDAWSEASGIPIRYLIRANRGIDQLARLEYFSGRVGSMTENLAYDYIFQMQDHYLDTESAASRWGPELGFKVKGDVVPDEAVFDLDYLGKFMNWAGLRGVFCDRNNPCYFEMDGCRYVAPNGGNFIITTSAVAHEHTQSSIQTLMDCCDETYRWALYVEFMWGKILFQEGHRFYCLKRHMLFDRWDEASFYKSPDDFPSFRKIYEAKSEG